MKKNVLFGGLVAGVVVFSSFFYFFKYDEAHLSGESDKRSVVKKVSIDNVSPVSEQDHILGSISAPIKIINFSDTECPYCKTLHTILQKIYNTYGKEGTVAIVFRHFPLDQLYPKGRITAEALECANKLGGNVTFWKYLDRLFLITPSENRIDLNELPRIAEYVGLERSSFIDCQKTNDFGKRIDQNLGEAQLTGGTIRPWSILILSSGTKIPFSGIPTYQILKAIIDSDIERIRSVGE